MVLLGPAAGGWDGSTREGGRGQCTELSVEGLDNAYKHLVAFGHSTNVSLLFISGVHKTCILTQDQKQIVKIRLKRIGEKRGPTITCLQWGHRVFSAEWYAARERADHRL